MRKFITSTIVLFSESIWLYFTFALFISVEFNRPIFVPVTWWIVAGISAYVINKFAAGRIHYVAVLVGNIAIATLLIIQNWITTVPEGALLTGFFFSIAIIFVYVRSATLVFKEPTRIHMLLRFELNMFIYLVLIFIFTSKDWVHDYFHLAFLGAIFSTLFGMIITLGATNDTEENEHVDVQTIGNPSGFITAISILFGGVILISGLFFLPAVREMLQQFTFFSIDKFVWTYEQIGNLFAWIFSLFSTPEIDGSFPEVEPNAQPDIGDIEEDMLLSLPIGWIIAGIAAVIVIILLIVFGFFLRKFRRPQVKEHVGTKRRANWSSWTLLLEKINALLRKMKKTFRTKFARFYKREVYWYFTKMERWGKKRGIVRGKSETTQAYVEKLMQIVQSVEVSEQEKAELISDLQKVSQDYEAAYYGNKEVSGNYKDLLKRLRNVHVKQMP